MGSRLTNGHFHGGIAELVVHCREAVFHLFFCNEGLDDAESSEGFLYLTDAIAPFRLGIKGVLLEFLADTPDAACQQRHYQQGEKRELPTHGKHRSYIDQNEDGVLDNHVER